MNEPYDPNRYALEDDDLEAMLVGAVDGRAVMGDNPVAMFFADARATTFARPEPDDRLGAVFAKLPGPDPTAFGYEPVPARIFGNEPPPEPTILHNVAPPPEHNNVAYDAPPVDGTALSSEVTTSFASTPSIDAAGLQSHAHTPPSFEHSTAQLFRPSIIDVVLGAIQPTPTKALMALSAVLMLFIGAQMLGAFDGSETEGAQEVVGVETSAGASTTETANQLTTASSLDGETEVTEAPVEEETSVPEQTTAPVTDPSTTTPTISTTTPTIAQTTTSELTTTTETSLPDSSVTSDGSSSSITVASTGPTVTEPTSTVITEPTTETTPTTVTTTQPVTVTLPPNRASRVPDDIPAGEYRGVVTGLFGCTVRVQVPGGELIDYSAPVGATIVFTLQDGYRATAGLGCPQSYTVTSIDS